MKRLVVALPLVQRHKPRAAGALLCVVCVFHEDVDVGRRTQMRGRVAGGQLRPFQHDDRPLARGTEELEREWGSKGESGGGALLGNQSLRDGQATSTQPATRQQVQTVGAEIREIGRTVDQSIDAPPDVDCRAHLTRAGLRVGCDRVVGVAQEREAV